MAAPSPPVLTVVRAGALSLIEDLGRPGYAHLGVGRSGAADLGALTLGNRLVGNPASAAAIETTLGGLVLTTSAPVLMCVTGAPAHPAEPLGAALNQTFALLPGQRLRLATPTVGLRSYVCVRGGVDVAPVLGSRSTDVHSAIGPTRLAEGDELPVGQPTDDVPAVDVAPVAQLPNDDSVIPLTVTPGPRDDWFADGARSLLTTVGWTVSPQLDRVGIRLDGPPLRRLITAELPSEGLVRGSIQVAANGQPIVFGPDHPTTGGYPVIAVLTAAASDVAAQLRPGQHIRFQHSHQASLISHMS